jgi:hypothetical protein
MSQPTNPSIAINATKTTLRQSSPTLWYMYSVSLNNGKAGQEYVLIAKTVSAVFVFMTMDLLILAMMPPVHPIPRRT